MDTVAIVRTEIHDSDWSTSYEWGSTTWRRQTVGAQSSGNVLLDDFHAGNELDQGSRAAVRAMGQAADGSTWAVGAAGMHAEDGWIARLPPGTCAQGSP